MPPKKKIKPKTKSRSKPHVVREIPVYLSKTLSDQLCLIQYPQRPATMSMDSCDIIQAKIKPQQNKIQLSIKMDSDSEYYDPESAEMLAEAAEGLGLDEDAYMPDRRVRIEKTTMESTVVPKLTSASRYAIGVMRKGELTLTPLKSIVQMKTVFPYLNKAEKARTAFQKEQTGGDTEDEAEEEATKVTVKFSRNTAAQGEKSHSRVSSYSARKKEEEEPWIDLNYVHSDPEEYEKLFSSKPETPFYVLPKNEYLPLLFPKHVETCIESGSGTKSKNHNPKISILQMREMTVPEQLKVLLSNAKVLQYRRVGDYLKTKLKSEFDDTSLLRSIQTVGILVQGCWVVKSDVIYPDDYKSGDNGIPGPVLQRGRDVILSQFTEERFVDRKKMIGLTKLPCEEVTEILTHTSRKMGRKGWEFLLPYDSDFVSKFPEVVQRQTLIWQMKKQQRIRHSSSTSGDHHSSSPPRRRRSRNKSISSGDDSEAESNLGRQRRSSETGGGSGSRRQRRNSARSDIGIPSKVES